MNKDWERLYEEAMSVLNPHDVSNRMWVGSVASAVLTKKGNIYKGICIDTDGSIGMCAERNALSTMLTYGESEITKVVSVYKDGNVIPKIKLSNNTAKITNPGFKDICRVYDKTTGKAEADFIFLRGEKEIDTSKPLVLTHPTERWKKITFENYELRTLQVEVIKDGKLVYNLPTLNEIKEYAQKELESFWDEYKRLDRPHLYKVDLSDGLYELKREMIESIREAKVQS